MSRFDLMISIFFSRKSKLFTQKTPFSVFHKIAEVPTCLVLKLQIQLKTKILFTNFWSKVYYFISLNFYGLFAVSFILKDARVIYIPMKWNKLQRKFSFENMKLPINKAI